MAKKDRLGYMPARPRTHFVRNCVCVILAMAAWCMLLHLCLEITSALVDIEDHTEAWLAAYFLSVMLTVMTIIADASTVLIVRGICLFRNKLLSVIMRILYMLYRFFAMLCYGLSLVMGAVMAMRLADTPVAALMIALHLGIVLAGYFGVRRMENKLREESL